MSDNPSSGRDNKQFRQIDNVIDYQNQDLARTYGFTKTEGEISISSEEFERRLLGRAGIHYPRADYQRRATRRRSSGS